jgi:hypothetical protein
MKAAQPARVGNATAVGNHLHFVAEVGAVRRDADGLVGRIKTSL